MQNKPPRVTAVSTAKLKRIKRDVNPCVILWLLEIGRFPGGRFILNFLVQDISHVPLSHLVLSALEVRVLDKIGN